MRPEGATEKSKTSDGSSTKEVERKAGSKNEQKETRRNEEEDREVDSEVGLEPGLIFTLDQQSQTKKFITEVVNKAIKEALKRKEGFEELWEDHLGEL